MFCASAIIRKKTTHHIYPSHHHRRTTSLHLPPSCKTWPKWWQWNRSIWAMRPSAYRPKSRWTRYTSKRQRKGENRNTALWKVRPCLCAWPGARGRRGQERANPAVSETANRRNSLASKNSPCIKSATPALSLEDWKWIDGLASDPPALVVVLLMVVQRSGC